MFKEGMLGDSCGLISWREGLWVGVIAFELLKSGEGDFMGRDEGLLMVVGSFLFGKWGILIITLLVTLSFGIF